MTHAEGDAPIVLVGLPGAGKTTAGRLAAERLGWTFVDLDLGRAVGDCGQIPARRRRRSTHALVAIENAAPLEDPANGTNRRYGCKPGANHRGVNSDSAVLTQDAL